MRIVYIFCEGAQDIALLRRLLPNLPDVRPSKRAIKDYPKPFGGFWIRQLQKVIAGAEGRPAEHRGKLTPPWMESAYEGTDEMFLLFDMQGKDQRSRVAKLLDDWGKLLANPDFGVEPDVTDWAVVMVVDADEVGIQARLNEVFTWFRDEGLLGDVPSAPQNPHWEIAKGCTVGGVVVHAADSNNGAVEDLWMPVAVTKVPERLREADEFITRHGVAESKSVKPGWRRKAMLTIAGQIEHPNDSLAVILRDTKWADDDEIAELAFGRMLLGFLGRIDANSGATRIEREGH